MSLARDFDDIGRDFGPEAIRAALDASKWPWPEAPPVDIGETAPPLCFKASSFTWRDPSTIPRRQFLYGFELRRKQLSAVVAPGAAGKTTLKVGRALCMVTGRDFLGHRVWNGLHRVWLVNLEDEVEEIEKTVHAFLKLWDLTAADLADRLFIDGVDSGGMKSLKIATEDRSGSFQIQRPIVDALVAELKERRIDYLDVDPFVSSHSVDENNNGAIDAVSKEWVAVAQQANCAVSLAHHVRKPNGTEASAFDARGAVSMINAARSVLVMQKMTKEAAQNFRVPECDRKRFFSVYDDKNNKAPPAAAAEWYEFIGFGLGNEDDTGPEDNVGAVQRWQAPDTFAGVTARHLLFVQQEIDKHPEQARKHSASPNWAGKLVARVLDLNPDNQEDKNAVKKMIDTWLATGALRSTMRADRKSEEREFVEVGTWATL
jgi:hypothetical protein